MEKNVFPEIAFVVYTRPRENRLPRKKRGKIKSGRGVM